MLEPRRTRRIRNSMSIAAWLAAVCLAAVCLAAGPSSGAPVPHSPGPPPPVPQDPRPDVARPSVVPVAPEPAGAPSDGDRVVARHVEAKQRALVACTRTRSAAGVTQIDLALAWSRTGSVYRVIATGGTSAQRTCVRNALLGRLADRGATSGRAAREGRGAIELFRTGAVRVRGIAITTPVVPNPDAPTPTPTPTPARPNPSFRPAPAADLHACKRSEDCTLHFTQHACVAAEPVAVNAAVVARDPAALAAAHPVRRFECGMGGDQYMDLRMENEGRWSAACEARRCVVHDAGPRLTRPSMQVRPTP